jgi:hypothetical protein
VLEVVTHPAELLERVDEKHEAGSALCDDAALEFRERLVNFARKKNPIGSHDFANVIPQVGILLEIEGQLDGVPRGRTDSKLRLAWLNLSPAQHPAEASEDSPNRRAVWIRALEPQDSSLGFVEHDQQQIDSLDGGSQIQQLLSVDEHREQIRIWFLP